MRSGIIISVGLTLLIGAPPARAGIEELARAGQWQRLLQVANRRADQLPLQPGEAYLAAHAARMVGDRAAEQRYLEHATEDGVLGDLAALKLARLLVADDPGGAVERVLPLVRRAPTRQVRGAAVDVTRDAVIGGVDDGDAAAISSAARSLPSSLRRRVELALALRDEGGRRDRLTRLLAASTRDGVALEAARWLQQEAEPSARQRWLVAKTLYRHALYDEAVPILDQLAATPDPTVASWEVAYIAGRCAFRRDRWEDAASWYGRALKGRRGAEGRAELEVHLARAHELAGDLASAVEAARRAVVSRTTDDRRLFLARLRLRLDQPDKARAGIAKIRGRTSRERGELMLGLYERRRGDLAAAATLLEGVDRRPWRGPASVLAAELAVTRGDHAAALRLMERHATELDLFWASRAREVMARIQDREITTWRERCSAQVEQTAGRFRRRALARWAALEIDPKVLESVRAEVAEEGGLEGRPDPPEFPPGLARELWQIGLQGEAVRWDPGGMPRGDAMEGLWTAASFERLQAPWLAIQTADGAWRKAGSDIPTRGFPVDLERGLHPLPYPEQLWAAAVDRAVPWSLLAGVAREESRWDPTVVSRVGARGLMQLMPSTATAIAGSLGRAAPSLENLFDPAVSLELGAVEISRLFGVFNGQSAPVVAAYNAGEAQARQWLDQCGSPCPTAWYVANITFSVTSTYTRDVLAAAETYSALYGAAPASIRAGSSASPRAARPQPPPNPRSRR